VETDRSAEVVRNFRALGLGALIAIGGDGTLGIAERLYRKGLPVVGVPKTIDNDIPATVITFGFDTAVSTATDALDRLHTTAEAHKRVMVVEVMGRYAGWIALNSGVSGGADVILIPEIPFDLEKICHTIRARERSGREFSIVVVAEGAVPVRGEMMTHGPRQAGREVRLGGIGEWLATEIEAHCGGKETRSLVLGHLQRGGPPTSFDRLLGTRFGSAAMRMVAEKKFGTMVALDPPRVMGVPLRAAVGRGSARPCLSIPTSSGPPATWASGSGIDARAEDSAPGGDRRAPGARRLPCLPGQARGAAAAGRGSSSVAGQEGGRGGGGGGVGRAQATAAHGRLVPDPGAPAQARRRPLRGSGGADADLHRPAVLGREGPRHRLRRPDA
jgi:6-phosphofructokinase